MLRRTATLLIFTALLVSTSLAQKPAAPGKTTAIHAANLIDGASGQVRHNVLIVIKGNVMAEKIVRLADLVVFTEPLADQQQ